MGRLSRRQFVRAAALAGAGAALAACAARQETAVAPPLVRTEDVSPTALPTQAGRSPLGNENRPAVNPNWNVRYFQPYTPVDPAQWRLAAEGLVEAPQTFSLDELRALPRREQSTRMKCVECWSARADWAGFSYAALTEVVRPLPEATWLYFECADGYYESLSVQELGAPRVLFAYEMDGELLLAEFGAPLRLVVPAKYGYKWPKAITRLTWENGQRAGYWPTVGPYSAEGTVGAGRDFPLDLQETREISGGEITDY